LNFLGETSNGEDPIFVDQVLQRALVEINEEGTEAAAATMMSAVAGSIPEAKPEPTLKFICDRAFFWILIQQDMNLPLFYGQISQPGEASMM